MFKSPSINPVKSAPVYAQAPLLLVVSKRRVLPSLSVMISTTGAPSSTFSTVPSKSIISTPSWHCSATSTVMFDCVSLNAISVAVAEFPAKSLTVATALIGPSAKLLRSKSVSDQLPLIISALKLNCLFWLSVTVTRTN
ncbi:hypothetical protein PSMA108079_20285 [Pseudoalteromonas mariniglutinosa]